MPYHDDTDRYCQHCGGKRFFMDTHISDYGYTARSVTRCWDCAPAVETDAPHQSVDDLRDAAMARMLSAMGMTRDEYHAHCGTPS